MAQDSVHNNDIYHSTDIFPVNTVGMTPNFDIEIIIEFHNF